jgi:hypothetical protein
MARGLTLLGTTLLLFACASEQAPEAADAGPGQQLDPDLSDDRDRDGLCDLTELEAGTDPDRADTDGDGLPDLAEVGNQFDPRQAGSPAEDQRAVLEAVPGVSLSFPVRTTVSGDGQGLTGFFEAVPSAYDPVGSAGDYFVGAEAVSADPGSNVRGFDRESQRFGAVVGETRLGFDLRFSYGEAESAECAQAYPFRYSVKSDRGETVRTRLYLLLVVPPRVAPGDTDVDFCLVTRCF